MSTSSLRLAQAARIFGWRYQRLTAYHGRIQTDYFVRDNWRIELRFDSLGRLSSAMRYQHYPIVQDRLIGSMPGKVDTVLGWMQD